MLGLVPWTRSTLARPNGREDMFTSLQREMNRLLEGFEGGLAPLATLEQGAWAPSLDVSETEKEIIVSAELPGMEEKDVDVSIQNGVLTIKGEKKEEKEGKNVYRMERRYGAFQRSVEIPSEIDKDKAEASYKNGVLTVKLPKTKAAQQEAKKVPVKNS